MGYYTNYNLEITGDPDKVNAFHESIKIKHGLKDKLLNGQERHEFDQLYEMLNGTYNAKFYEHEEFFLKLSKLVSNQDLTFVLDGEGEETGDIWKKYFKNGKMFYTKGTIVFDDYDESRLT